MRSEILIRRKVEGLARASGQVKTSSWKFGISQIGVERRETGGTVGMRRVAKTAKRKAKHDLAEQMESRSSGRIGRTSRGRERGWSTLAKTNAHPVRPAR